MSETNDTTVCVDLYGKDVFADPRFPFNMFWIVGGVALVLALAVTVERIHFSKQFRKEASFANSVLSLAAEEDTLDVKIATQNFRMMLALLVFAVTSFLALLLPELAPFADFIQAGYIAVALQAYIQLVFGLTGGPGHLVYLASKVDKVKVWGAPPLGAPFKCCMTPRHATDADIKRMYLLIRQATVLVPTVKFLALMFRDTSLYTVLDFLTVASTFASIHATKALENVSGPVLHAPSLNLKTTFIIVLNAIPALQGLIVTQVFEEDAIINGQLVCATHVRTLWQSFLVSCLVYVMVILVYRAFSVTSKNVNDFGYNMGDTRLQMLPKETQFCPVCGEAGLLPMHITNANFKMCTGCGCVNIRGRMPTGIEKPSNAAASSATSLPDAEMREMEKKKKDFKNRIEGATILVPASPRAPAEAKAEDDVVDLAPGVSAPDTIVA